MYVFISIMILLASVFLVLIVLVQNSKGGGLAASFSSSNQVLGVRKTTDFLEKATWIAAGVVIILCIGITAYIPRENTINQNSEVLPNINLPVQQAVPDFGAPLQPEESTQQPQSEEIPVN